MISPRLVFEVLKAVAKVVALIAKPTPGPDVAPLPPRKGL